MNHKSTVTLETERLVLRRLEMNDAEAMFRNWANDPEVTKYMPYNTCETLEQTQVIITEWLDSIDGIETNSRDIFAIILKSTAEPIGTIDYTETDHAVKSAEIGYQLGKRWWHNGYAAEALIALIKYCFQECGLKRLWAMYNANNPNSGAVMRKAGMIYEGTFRKDRLRKGVRRDSIQYAILAEDYFNTSHKEQEMAKLNIATIKNLTELMYHNLRIAMDTVDWSADICGAPAWRYIYHTLHSADKWFINPSKRFNEPEPAFHAPGLDWPDNTSEIVLNRETLYSYYEQVRQKILDYLGSLSDIQLSERPKGCTNSRLGLIMEQFRHMYAHIGILNGITIAYTNRYLLIINSSTWRSGKLPEGLYDVEERK